MANFRQTAEALIDLQANNEFGLGSHRDSTAVTGVHSNIILGEMPFDPNVHDPYDIDHMSLMGAATGDLYVTEVLPERPMTTHLAIDATARDEHAVVSEGKAAIAVGLGNALEFALPGISDRLDTYRFVTEESQGRENDIVVDPENGEAYAQIIKQLAYGGLTFVLTDGRQLALPERSLQRVPVVAIKVNHILERSFPVGAGVLPDRDSRTGEVTEFNTAKQSKVQVRNAELEAEHRAIVARLQAAGMAVAEVVTSNDSQLFDTRQADASIAAAVRTLARKA